MTKNPNGRPTQPQLTALMYGATIAFCAGHDLMAAQLPVACAAGTCGTSVNAFATSGAATVQQTAQSMTVTQTTGKATLNWSSFNVSPDASVVFHQPSSTAVALNRIYDANPSAIFGSLTANGQVYLINSNGFLFGAGSTVNVAGLIASSLNITDKTFDAGILAPLANSAPALEPFKTVGGVAITNTGTVAVEAGAQLTATDGGRLLLAAPTVLNGGTLKADNGQVILAAGQKVYLQASTAPELRGLIVEVDQGGTAWNQLSGAVSTRAGNISLVGLAVNQDGRLSATTTVSANGSIYLTGADGARWDGTNLTAQVGHDVKLGAKSLIQILPEYSDTTTAVDAQAQLQSRVSISGQNVLMQGGTIDAPSGLLDVTAASNPKVGPLSGASSPASIRIDAGTHIDLSGSTAELPVAANLVTLQLRSNELADDPQQRNGALKNQTVVVDARANGGTGTTIANATSAIGAVGKNIAQRTETGGKATFISEGDVVFSAGATINTSGGATNFLGGVIQTTQLIGADGKLYDIGTANPNLTYIGVLNPTYTQTYDKWGIKEVAPTPGLGHYEPGYPGRLGRRRPVCRAAHFTGGRPTGKCRQWPLPAQRRYHGQRRHAHHWTARGCCGQHHAFHRLSLARGRLCG
jgi:filamentous hemagglutinin family protein